MVGAGPVAPGDASNARGLGHAGAWAASGRLVGRAIDIAVLILLARVLSPGDFGLVAMAMTVILLVEAATEVPLVQPILRAKTPEDRHYDTAFTLGLIRALVVGSIVAAASPLVARYYGDQRLVLLVVFLALAPAFRSLVSPRLAARIRDYDMRPDFVMNVVGKLMALAMVATVVFSTGSFWAIAVGTVTSPIVMCVLSYVLAPYRPRLSFAAWPDFADVVGWNTVNQLFRSLNFQLDRIVLGRVATPAELGRYSLASDISSLPVQAFVQPMRQPLVSAFSRAEDRHEQDQLWLLGINGLLALLGPMFLALALFADPLVLLILGAQWSDMVPFLVGLSLIAVVNVPTWLLPPLAVVLYRADLTAKRTMLSTAIRAPLTIAGALTAGAMGAIGARALSTVAEVATTLHAAKTLVGLPWPTQLWGLRRTVAGLVVFAVVALISRPQVVDAPVGVAEHALAAGWLVLAGLVAAASMAGAMGGLWVLEGRPAGLEHRVSDWLVRRRVGLSRTG